MHTLGRTILNECIRGILARIGGYSSANKGDLMNGYGDIFKPTGGTFARISEASRQNKGKKRGQK
jgi:hypothetical protein